MRRSQPLTRRSTYLGLCLLSLVSCNAVIAQFTWGLGDLGGLISPAGTPAVAYPGLDLGGLGLGTTAYAQPATTTTYTTTTTTTQPLQTLQQPTSYTTSGNMLTDTYNSLFGWLFPVYTPSRRDNCVVYEGRSTETVQQVAQLFGLNFADVLSDNQGVISNPNEPLAGRSILLCGRNGRRPQPIQAPVPAAPVPAAPEPAAPVRAAPEPAAPLATPAAPAPAPAVKPPPAPVRATPIPIRANAPTATAVKSLVDPKVQANALLKFKTYVDPKGEVLKDWTNKIGHCTWVYVTCDANKNIIRLNMVYLGLEGRLPPGDVMKNLPHLTHIYLGGNMLKGNLPPTWGATMRPVELFLNDNMFTGILPPQWGNMKTLKVLSLPYNQLMGALPPAWGRLSELQILKLNNNNLKGPVPQEWGNLKQISTITIFNNKQVTGCVPEAWNGPGKSGSGYFQSPTGVLSSDIKDATRGTSITGFCCKGWRYCV